jgi:3-deoxy-manno-octulosonate cytidylyltransferase (CMP-KDO synthetase)
MQVVGIIPARYASARFPGKALVDINGKTMIQRVYEQASKALDWVFVATDDNRIADHVKSFNGKVIMTSPDHKSGTERCSEALKKILAIEDCSKFDVVINIQGDEPFIKPEQLRHLASCFDNESVQIATLAKPITDNAEIFNPNCVKVIRNKDLQAIYFSRTPIPYLINIEKENWHKNFTFLKHVGIYAYKTSTLKELTMLKPSDLEQAESLEQNRWLENSYNILVETTTFENISIDTPEDLEKIKKIKDIGDVKN